MQPYLDASWVCTQVCTRNNKIKTLETGDEDDEDDNDDDKEFET
jgi:hypothetical protein